MRSPVGLGHRPGGAATLAVDADARVLASEGSLRSLLENPFRNSVEHGAADGRVEVRGVEWAGL